MMVELGRRVDDSICETYFRNWEDGDDSGVTLDKIVSLIDLYSPGLVLTVSGTFQQQSSTSDPCHSQDVAQPLRSASLP